MSHAVEVVDDCGEDHRPSPDERVVAVIGVVYKLTEGPIERNGRSLREAGRKTGVSFVLLESRMCRDVVPLDVCRIVRRERRIEHSRDDRLDRGKLAPLVL